jgi:hypothetical protein
VGVLLGKCGNVGAVQVGVRFRTIVHEDGTIERWRSPRLPAWEVPRRDPAERRPLAPDVAARRRDEQRAWRERQRARKAAQPAIEPRGEYLQTPSA